MCPSLKIFFSFALKKKKTIQDIGGIFLNQKVIYQTFTLNSESNTDFIFSSLVFAIKLVMVVNKNILSPSAHLVLLKLSLK